MKSCTVLVILVPRSMVNTLHGRWQETLRLSEDLVVYRGESRLAMALEGGDVRVRSPRDLPKPLSIPRRRQTCQAAPEDQTDPETI